MSFDQTTHWDDCWKSGPEHYECARTRIARLTGDLRGANRECEVRQERELGYLARAESAEAEVERLLEDRDNLISAVDIWRAEVERLRAVLFVARHALEYAGGNWIGAMSSRPIWDALIAIDAARGES